MAEFTNGVKRTFYRCLRAAGKGASLLADKADNRLSALNALRDMAALDAALAAEVNSLWQNGQPLPREITVLLEKRAALAALVPQPEPPASETDPEPEGAEQTPNA